MSVADAPPISDVTLVATARNFLSRTLLALNVELDVPPDLDPVLQEALLAPLAWDAGWERSVIPPVL